MGRDARGARRAGDAGAKPERAHDPACLGVEGCRGCARGALLTARTVEPLKGDPMAEGTRGRASWVSLAVALGVGVVAACRGAETKSGSAAPNAQAQPPPAPEAKLFPDLGSFHRKVTTSNAQAQPYFDQGLLFCFCFNHEEAIRSFRKAAELDPKCAMAFWGAALAAGPNINNPTMDEAATKAAADAIAKARESLSGQSEVERDLIEALAKRYVFPPPPDRAALDQAYADAMRDVWHRHGND